MITVARLLFLAFLVNLPLVGEARQTGASSDSQATAAKPEATAAAPEPREAAAKKPDPSDQEQALAQASEQAEKAKAFVIFGKWVIPGWLVELFRWSNFAVLFGLLGYLLRKPMREFFASRAWAIVEGLARGRQAREEAARRLKEIESRLAGLEAEVAALREMAHAEAEADHDRFRARARAEAEKILAAAEQEIASLTRFARAEIKSYAAGLAVRLAERRIRGLLTPERQATLLRQYAESLRSQRL